MSYQYPQPRPAVSVEVVVLRVADAELQVALRRRREAPFDRQWCLPGGAMRLEESLAETAQRELLSQTGLSSRALTQLAAFGEPGRDPRERSIAIAFLGLTAHAAALSPRRPGDAGDAGDAEIAWWPLDSLPLLAFDHGQMVAGGVQHLRATISVQPVAFELLPAKFPLRDLQSVYEAVLRQNIDKRNFRKKLLAMGVVKPLQDREQDVAHRAAQLYQFDRRAYQQRIKKGLPFELS